jgi:hypothetical protein
MSAAAKQTPKMGRALKFLLWAAVFCGLLLALDQVLLRVPLRQPGLVAVQDFYRDFRGRLLELGGGTPDSIEAVIDRAPPVGRESVPVNAGGPAPPPPAAGVAPGSGQEPPGTAKPAGPRYLYVDAAGELRFADTLEEIPRRFRADAQPLEP